MRTSTRFWPPTFTTNVSMSRIFIVQGTSLPSAVAGEPEFLRCLAQDAFLRLLVQTQFLGEDFQVPGVRDVRAPQLAREVAAPDAPGRAERLDDLATRPVH